MPEDIETPEDPDKEEDLEITEIPEDPDKEEDDEPEEIEARTKKEDKIDYGDLDKDDAETIGAVVQAHTASIKKELQDTNDRLEVASFIKSNPDYAKYEANILRHVQHEAYKLVPIKNIASMVASKDLIRMGAKKEREATEKANSSRTPGSAERQPQGAQKDWLRVPKDDFEAQKRIVMGQQV